MSTPLQADLSSVVEKGAMSRRDIAKFLGQPTQLWVFGRGGGTVRINSVYEEARTSEKKKERKDKRTFLQAHLCSRM